MACKFLLLLCSVLLVVFAAACEGERQPAGGDVTPTTVPTATFTPSPVPTPTPAECDDRASVPEGADDKWVYRALGMDSEEATGALRGSDLSPWSSSSSHRPAQTSGWSYGLEVPGETAPGSAAMLEFEISSGARDDVPLQGNPPYDFAVLNSKAEEIWRWSRDGSADDMVNALSFSTHGEVALSAEWELMDRDHDPVGEGFYWVYGVVNLTANDQIVSGPELMFVGERPALSELIDVRVEAPDAVQCGEAARLELTMTNVSEGMLPLEFGVNIDDYEVTTKDGEHVWRWWENETMPYVGIQRIFKPGESQEYVRYWKLVDSQKPIGNLVPPGEYRVRGFIRAELAYVSAPHRDEKAYSDWHTLEVRPRE